MSRPVCGICMLPYGDDGECGCTPNVRNQADHFELKESVSVEGITEDYVWYKASLLRQKMRSWSHELEQVVSVMESRHKEHLKIIDDLLTENKKLRDKLNEK
jgi:hypothetical protein